MRHSADKPGTSPECHAPSGNVIGVFSNRHYGAKATIVGQIIAAQHSRPDRANMPPKDLLKVRTRYVELFIGVPHGGVRRTMKP